MARGSAHREAFTEIIPHLTLAHGVAGDLLDMIEARVVRSLPITASLVEAHLYVVDGERWRMRARLPFQPHPRRETPNRPFRNPTL